ncbi:hypothetical protein CPB84DRAFT_1846937 [Gymnopilus junonius]|uniref:HMG box domain-containing protein n=1 Tax=Gymnopilus junonius TaxID=109634 RepID=A0A9P5TP50_GYMJU|nr:hypothetical protein CPB84DRAFT_1846937 [Gymnopilus junonius]
MIFSFVRSSRAVGRSLALKHSFASRLSALPAAAPRTPYAPAAALVSARARFFATTKSAGFTSTAAANATHASEAAPKEKAATTKEKKPVRKTAAKKKTVAAKTKTAGAKPRPNPRNFQEGLRPPFKYPGNSWINFIKQFNESKAGGDTTDMAVILAEASKVWKEMSEEAKQAYAPSREAIAEYSQKRKEWLKNLPKKNRKAFTKENYAKVGGVTFAEKTQAIKELYHNLSEAEKNELRQRIMRVKEEIRANAPQAEA